MDALDGSWAELGRVKKAKQCVPRSEIIVYVTLFLFVSLYFVCFFLARFVGWVGFLIAFFMATSWLVLADTTGLHYL